MRDMYNYPVKVDFLFSRILKPSKLKIEYLSDLLLKFNSTIFNNLKGSGLSHHLNISIMNIRVKSRLDFLKLNRLFDPLRVFCFFVRNNYRIRNSKNLATKLSFISKYLTFFSMYDFIFFFLSILTTRSRALSRSFISGDKLQINFYNCSAMGFLDSRLDYYGWNEPLLMKFNLKRVSMKRKVGLDILLSNFYNYFVFFLLKIKLKGLED